MACEHVAYLQELLLQVFYGMVCWALLGLLHVSFGRRQLGVYNSASCLVVSVDGDFAVDPVLQPNGGLPKVAHGS